MENTIERLVTRCERCGKNGFTIRVTTEEMKRHRVHDNLTYLCKECQDLKPNLNQRRDVFRGGVKTEKPITLKPEKEFDKRIENLIYGKHK